MSKISCPQCGAIGEEGAVCEYCGSTIFLNKGENILNKIDLEYKKSIIEKNPIQIYESNLSPEFAIEAVKNFIYEDLKSASKSMLKDVYEEFIFPIEDKLSLFKYSARLYQIPIFWYNVEAEDYNNNLRNYNFLAYAGDNKSFPPIIVNEFRFRHCDDLEEDLGIKLEKQVNNHTGFKKDEHEIWQSLYSQKVRFDFFRRSDYPNIKQIIIPVLVVLVEISPSIVKDNTKIHKEFIIGNNRKILNDNQINVIQMLIQYYLGDDWEKKFKERKIKKLSEIKEESKLHKKKIRNKKNLLSVIITILIFLCSYYFATILNLPVFDTIFITVGAGIILSGITIAIIDVSID